MMANKKYLTIFLFILPAIILGQAEVIFNGISLNESLAEVTKKVKSISEKTKLISVDIPSFPLAEKKEDHLICLNLKTKKGIVEKVVFTFADNKLVYIEARGNVYNVLGGEREEKAVNYLGYEIYIKERLFLKKKQDIAWVLNQEAMHVNLFTWENLYLIEKNQNSKKLSFSKKIPSFFKMGKSIDEIKPLLETNSNFINTQKLDGSDPNAQVQINCFGVSYLGFPRKAEARFGDNKLNVVWILTAKAEEDRIRKALIEQYGEPIFVNDSWEIFNNWQVGLRKDKPEVLLIKQELGLQYKSTLFKK